MIVDEIRQNAARTMAAKKDNIVSQAITDRIGEGWTPEGLAETGRLQVIEHQGATQTMILDGERMVEFHPESSTVSGPNAVGVSTLAVQQQYRVF